MPDMNRGLGAADYGPGPIVQRQSSGDLNRGLSGQLGDSARDKTALEMHLSSLEDIGNELTAICHRLEAVVDRNLGSSVPASPKTPEKESLDPHWTLGKINACVDLVRYRIRKLSEATDRLESL